MRDFGWNYIRVVEFLSTLIEGLLVTREMMTE